MAEKIKNVIDKPFQRQDSKSNAHVGRIFEESVQEYFHSQGLMLDKKIKVNVGFSLKKKEHEFDLGSLVSKVIVECKSHRWTRNKKKEIQNVPSAKLTVWNEAMYYFVCAPKEYRKILVVAYDYWPKRDLTLAQYYIKTYYHLIPDDVELWELNEDENSAIKLLN